MSEAWKQKVIDRLLSSFAVGFGLGLSPVMPGTMGSLLALLIAPLLLYSHYPYLWYIVLCLWAYKAAAFEGKKRQDYDHPAIVCDEVIGLLPSLLYFPYSDWLFAFVLFRVLDILKPWPVSVFDRQKGPAACLSDDLVAGVLTLLLLGLV